MSREMCRVVALVLLLGGCAAARPPDVDPLDQRPPPVDHTELLETLIAYWEPQRHEFSAAMASDVCCVFPLYFIDHNGEFGAIFTRAGYEELFEYLVRQDWPDTSPPPDP
jgi:hypothetical protein